MSTSNTTPPDDLALAEVRDRRKPTTAKGKTTDDDMALEEIRS